VLTTIDPADFSQDAKDNLKGQALFLRALAYFDLVKKFGGVPLFLEPPTSYQGTFKTRSPVAAIYEQVLADASQAAALLPARTGQHVVGRATAGAAYTLLADVYITLQRWAEAETALRAVEKMDYSLLADYADIFRPANKGNAEIVFEINYVEATSQPLYSTFLYSFIPELSNPAAITGVGPISRNGNGGLNLPTPDLAAAYQQDTDKRYGATIGYYTGPSPLVGIPTYQHMPYVKKYLHPHAIPGQTNVNWPVYRYAEVLLMLAESLNEQQKPAQALAYLNQVRSRAGLSNIAPAGQTQLRDLILQERRLELAFENKRYHDLVRTGMAVNVLNAFGEKVKAEPQHYYYAPGNAPVPNAFQVTNDYLLYPIPISELVVNNSLEQNPGY
jgi:starch-binding outer membrane protein, SusD/RagB family